MRRLHFIIAAATGVALGGGCYTFSAVTGSPTIGTDVRATVTNAEALRLSEQTGQLASTVEGRVMGASDDSITVSTVTFRAVSEVSGSRQLRQLVTISRAGIEGLATRELSAWRSGLAGAVLASAVYAVVGPLNAGGNPDDTDNGEPIGTLIPIFRIPLGR